MNERNNEHSGAAYVRVRLTAQDKDNLTELRAKHGFKSNYAFLQASVRITLNLLRRAEEHRLRLEGAGDVAQLFAALSEWENPDWVEHTTPRGRVLAEHLLGLGQEGDAEALQTSKPSNKYEQWYKEWLGKAYSRHFADFSKIPQRADSKGYTALDYYQSLAIELSRCPLDLEREEEWLDWAESKVAAKLKELTIHSSRVSEYRKVRGANS